MSIDIGWILMFGLPNKIVFGTNSVVLDGKFLGNGLWFPFLCVSIQYSLIFVHSCLLTTMGKSHVGYSLGCSLNRLGLSGHGSVFV